MKRKLTVGIDMDGVLIDTIRHWMNVYNSVYSDSVKYENILDYDLLKTFTKLETREQLVELIKSNSFWDDIEMIPEEGLYDTVKKMNEEFNLYVVTSTDYRVAPTKFKRFLELFDFLNESQLILTANKRLINVSFLIDDCPDNLKGLHSTIGLLVDAPYNQQASNIRVKSIKEAYEFINKCLHKN